MPADVRYAFLVDWLDPQAQLVRQYLLFYYANDNSVEMDDLKNRRKFLRRCEYPGIRFDNLFIGATVNVYSRELVVSDFGDEFTKTALQTKKEKTLALIKPDAYLKAGRIIDAIQQDGFRIAQMRTIQLTMRDAEEFYAEHRGKPFYEGLTSFMSSGTIVAMELVTDGAIQKWRRLIGPTNTFTAQKEAPSSLRALYGTDGTKNACHGSDSTASAEREIGFFFGQPGRFPPTARFSNCTLAMVKPHAVVKGDVMGKIVDAIIEDGFEVSAMQMMNMTRVNAGELLEVYKSVLPEYQKMAEELCNGPLLALEVRAENAVPALRALAGPHDPELARILRPKTLRALYGVDTVMNALHVTDLQEDGQLECDYVFRILDS
uniref:DM10 domain-containing protein n=1 Tax=Hemiselmis andersenii TaxID=464988 RepID=A0A6U4IQU8_HEMAN|mmetsp:Transcript_26015/g.60282  ORF Transcript_26015/g.60282 Transcript_26015/m.60282 type:complete len:376 (-) Transcript_26015:258-1385(-)